MSKYHLIGLGGIGMSAVARILLQQGQSVQGSDLTYTPLLECLENEGAQVRIGHQAEWVEPDHTVVYSSDIGEHNPERQRAKTLGLPLWHRSELLDRLMQGKKPLCVTGTHGKTTTSALLAHTLSQAGLDPSFVVGGIVQQSQTNGKAGKGVYFVAEADESDGSFLKTVPFGAIVTNCEKEHLNYWHSEERLFEGFRQFCAQVRGPLLWCADDLNLQTLALQHPSYGFNQQASWRIEAFRQTDQGVCFHLNEYLDVELSLFGRHNALNGAAVFALATLLGVSSESIRHAFRTFQGTKRRLDRLGEARGVILFDDYAHHPTEIKTTLEALRLLASGRLVVIFQPHRYSRVRDLFEQIVVLQGHPKGSKEARGRAGKKGSQEIAMPQSTKKGQSTAPPVLGHNSPRITQFYAVKGQLQSAQEGCDNCRIPQLHRVEIVSTA